MFARAFFQDSVLFEQMADHPLLILLHPAGQGDEKGSPGLQGSVNVGGF